MILLKLNPDHNWHKMEHVAKVIKIENGKNTFYRDHGKSWQGKFDLPAKSWIEMGYEECGEEEALAVLKLKKF
jgi:hypothetical protein